MQSFTHETSSSGNISNFNILVKHKTHIKSDNDVMMFLNCQSLTQKKADPIYSNYLCNSNVIFLGLTEINSKDNSVANTFHFNNYLAGTSYSGATCKGGGAGIWYCRRNLLFLLL